MSESGSLRPTGIDALDVFLGGGLPDGFTTLLLAPAGAGSEIFAKQYAAGVPEERVVYVTTDESAREVHRAVQDHGWSFEHARVLDLQTRFAEAMLDAQEKERRTPEATRRTFDPRDLVEGTSSMDVLRNRPGHRRQTAAEPEDYLGMLMDAFAGLRGPDRMVIHSLDFFLNLYPLERVVAALTALKATNARGGGLMLWVLAKGAHGSTVERRLELLADCLIELEMTRKGTSFERFCMVKKVKNRPSGIGVSTYEIGQDGFHLETLERIV